MSPLGTRKPKNMSPHQKHQIMTAALFMLLCTSLFIMWAFGGKETPKEDVNDTVQIKAECDVIGDVIYGQNRIYRKMTIYKCSDGMLRIR